MIEKLETPETPIVKPNTHAMNEFFSVTFGTDGKATAQYQRVKGRMEGGSFVKDEGSRIQMGCDGLTVTSDMTIDQVMDAMNEKIRVRDEARAMAEAKREELRQLETQINRG